MTSNDIYKKQIEDRKKYTELILSSTSDKKIVVAGAGTGKSFTFKTLLSTKSGKSLALTFINNLASDLTKDLDGLSDVYTFHGYCKSLLHKIASDGINSKFHYYPKLPKIVELDALIFGSNLEKFDDAFQTLLEDERIEFYISRANYYNAVGHNDSVYRTLKFFKSNSSLIPKFEQIVVDEYQDFNELEVKFIEQLEIASPVLIAGDDDQAIYSFKNASPQYIRTKATAGDYDVFELPYCSRCTNVIVTSVNEIIVAAQKSDHLKNRITKKYECFLQDKAKDSQNYPKLIHAQCSIQNKQPARNYIGKFIESEIKKIPQTEINLAKEKGYPCVLIVGPSQYLKQVHGYLKDKFPNVNYEEKKDEQIELIDGYLFLLKNRESNLGWRVILEFETNELKTKILKATEEKHQPMHELLERDFIEKHMLIVGLIEKVINGLRLSVDDENIIKSQLKVTAVELKDFFSKPELENEIKEEENEYPTIKLSTISGSKGMSAGFVFVLGMNEGDLPRRTNNPTDHEICQLIVALTRTRKKCYLISNKRFGINYGIRPSSFINWIDNKNVENIIVDANYFKNLAHITSDGVSQK